MAGFGNLVNPYVENPYAGWVINVHWRKKKPPPVGGTCLGAIGFGFGIGSWTGSVGLIDLFTGAILASVGIDLVTPLGTYAPAENPINLSAGGALLVGESIGVTAFIEIDTTPIATPGLYYPFHPTLAVHFASAPLSNSGDLSPFGQSCDFPGPCHWTAVATGTAIASNVGSGFNMTIDIVVTP